MQASKSAKAFGAKTRTLEIGKNDALGITDNDVLYISVAIDQNPDLSADLVRCFGQVAGKFLGDDLPRRNPPLVKLFETVYLMRL